MAAAAKEEEEKEAKEKAEDDIAEPEEEEIKQEEEAAQKKSCSQCQVIIWALYPPSSLLNQDLHIHDDDPDDKQGDLGDAVVSLLCWHVNCRRCWLTKLVGFHENSSFLKTFSNQYSSPSFALCRLVRKVVVSADESVKLSTSVESSCDSQQRIPSVDHSLKCSTELRCFCDSVAADSGVGSG